MKLFVFDVDGTISDNLALKLDKDLIKELNIRLKNGDCVAIASGRPYIGIIQYLNQLGEGTKFCICANGASITDINGNILMKNTIKLKDFYEFCDTHKEILESKDGNIYTYLNDAVGYFKYDEFIKGETAFNNNFPALDLRNANLSPDTDILKFMVASLPEHSIEIENSIEKSWRDRFSVLRTSSVFIEFINKKTDKASGVEFLMNYLNIKKEDIYTFGDSENDYLMIKNFNGIAMGNASDECKKVAKFITKSVKENGALYAIQHFVK